VVIAPPASIAIIGGGIGSLTAAASLLRAGFDVRVYEQATALGEVGAGINIGPNASRILHRLGIADVLERSGVKPLSFDQRRWDDGRVLLRAPLGEAVEAAFGAPYLHPSSRRSASCLSRCHSGGAYTSGAPFHTARRSLRLGPGAF
jgi:2-polyprenyl-6-methoxyphenol hydroxylase-like FAD-dependent oxidoreductase